MVLRRFPGSNKNKDEPSEKIELEKDSQGNVLPTLRNKETMEQLYKEHNNDPRKIKEAVGRDDYYKYTQSSQQYRPVLKREGTEEEEEETIEETKRKKIINDLNSKYLSEKHSKSGNRLRFRH